MTTRLVFVALGLVVTAGIPIAGQHAGHAGTPLAVDAVQAAQCGRAQSVVTGLVEAALTRVESARLTNNAGVMRDAVDDLQATLVDIKRQLAPCGQLAASSEAAGHADHAMPSMPGVQQAPAAAPGPPATPPGLPNPATPAPPATPAAHDAHAGHQEPAPPTGAAASPRTVEAPVARRTDLMAAPATELASLKCRTPLDPKTTPRMLHQGRMYYFCSEQERSAFAKDPSRYALSAGAAAPAHAH